MDNKIFSKDELVELNEKMLGRGVPVSIDGLGYNKADYGVCATYYNGLSYAQYYDLAIRLIKYCHTQLHISKEDMKATAEYYKELIEDSDRKNGISVKIIDSEVMFSFKYNEKFINTIKKQPSSIRRYDAENKCWLVKIENSINTLEMLEKEGADVENSVQFIEKIKLKTTCLK